MSLIAGSYERYLFGYKLKPARLSDQNPNPNETLPPTLTLTLTPLFSYAAHTSPVKSVAVAGVAAASSGADDIVKLYDLSTSSELGSVPLPSSATSLSFFTPPSLSSSFPRNLIAGAEDGRLSVFDVDPFVCLTSVAVHRRPINDVAVHPSGKVALTVARGSRLGMVNLVRGRRSFACRLEKEASIIDYCVGGERFFMVAGEAVTIHEAEDARLIGEFEGPKKILCAAPAENGLILTGGDDRGVTAWDTVSGKVAYSIEDAHKSRVKGIVVLTRNSSADEDPFLVASASSDGVIRVWDVRAVKDKKSEPLCEADTKSRLTCLAGSSIKSFSRSLMRKDVSKEDDETKED